MARGSINNDEGGLSDGLWGQPDPVEAYKWCLLASEHGKEEANDRLAELQERVSQADQQQASPLASQWVAAPEPRTTSLVAWPVALPTHASPQSTNEPMQIVTKTLPDDLFGESETKPTHSAPVPVAAAQADMQVAGCFDRIQAAATCQSTCTDPTFAEKMAISQFAHEKGAQAPVNTV